MAAIRALLEAATVKPASLLLEGDAGIGKTTLVLAATEIAESQGFRVLRCAGSSSEARLSHAALADLLHEIDPGVIEDLPPPQREALDAALLRVDPGEQPIDPHAVATGALTVLERLALSEPLLIAIDDLQWVDRPSAQIVEFCTRRLVGPVGVIASNRADKGPRSAKASILVDLPEQSNVLRVGALPPDKLTELLRRRVPKDLSRSDLAQVGAISGGNPFYALELAGSIAAGDAPRAALALPSSLEQLVAARSAGLDPAVGEALLAVAALADPTVELIERALGKGAAGLLDRAEVGGLLRREGSRVRFSHPLLAHGVYAAAPAPQRREIHRRLSEVVTDVEERARHLAHAGVLPEAVVALDEAASQVRARGAPEAAAELLELALELDESPGLRLRAAEHHFDAGEFERAGELAEGAVIELNDREERARALLLLGELCGHAGRYTDAWRLLEQAQAEAASIDRMRVTIAAALSYVVFQLGDWKGSAETARSMLAAARRLEEPGQVAKALGIVAFAEFCIGEGLEEELVEEALRLEDPTLRTGNFGPPSAFAFLLYSWSGRFEDARAAAETCRRLAAERGEEPVLAWLAAMYVQPACWSGNLEEARSTVEEATSRGLPELGQTGAALALWSRSLADAFAGRAEEARRGAEESLALFEAAGALSFSRWPLITLGFLELSAGDYAAACSRLEVAAAELVTATGLREPAAYGAGAGDAAEALVGVGRIEEAERLAALLEERGAAQDRPWAIAVGARCRGLVLAARGEVEGAAAALEEALVAHEGLPMPIERGRSLLVLGRIRRRLRKRSAARQALEEALGIFEAVGSPLWAEQARTEINTLGLRPTSGEELTPAELRVATLVAGGLSNKQVAMELVISPKTVEAHLGRAYRKLDVHSRAELAAQMTRPG